MPCQGATLANKPLTSVHSRAKGHKKVLLNEELRGGVSFILTMLRFFQVNPRVQITFFAYPKFLLPPTVHNVACFVHY